MSKFNKSNRIATVADCGILATAATLPLPGLAPEKRQIHQEELFRLLDSTRFGGKYAAALRNNDTSPDHPIPKRNRFSLHNN